MITKQRIIELGFKDKIGSIGESIAAKSRATIDALKLRHGIGMAAAKNGLHADVAREAVRNIPAAAGAAGRTGARQGGRYIRGFFTKEAGNPATVSDMIKEGMAGAGDWAKKNVSSRTVRNVGIGAGALLAGAGIYRAGGSGHRKVKSDEKFRNRAYRDFRSDVARIRKQNEKRIALTARDELHSIIEFRIKPSITYHDVEQQIHSRKARVHREKSNEYLAGAGLATGAAGTIAAVPELSQFLEGKISRAGSAISKVSLLKSIGNKLERNPRAALLGTLAVAPVAFGGAALAHRVAGWSNDSKANKAQKRAQAVRMERFKKLQDSHPVGTKFSAREELGLILFGGDPRPRNSLGMFSGGADGGPNPGSMQITYQPQVAQQGLAEASQAPLPEYADGEALPQPPVQKRKIVKRG